MGVGSLGSDARKLEEPMMKLQKLSADVRTVRMLSVDNVGSSDLGLAMQAQSLRSRLLKIRSECTLLQQNRIREATQKEYLKAVKTLLLSLSLASIANRSIEACNPILS